MLDKNTYMMGEVIANRKIYQMKTLCDTFAPPQKKREKRGLNDFDVLVSEGN